MAKKNTSRAAQGAGTIRKKTTVRNGRTYTYWEARVTVGKDTSGKQIQKSFSGKDAEGGSREAAGGYGGDRQRRLYGAIEDDSRSLADLVAQ